MVSLFSRFSPVPSFPDYKGIYEVGTLDLELPVSFLVDAGLSPPCPPHSDIPTIQFRVFYPAALKGKASGEQNSPNWIPSPRKEYVAAYCRFAGASDFLANVLSYIPRHIYYIKLPAYSGHPCLPESESPSLRFPIVIFSHGLGGTRNTYSYITASLAAQGAIVFCPEHRDGSAPASFIREPTRKSGLEALKRNLTPSTSPGNTQQVDGLPQTPSSSGSDSEESENTPSKTTASSTSNPSKPSTTPASSEKCKNDLRRIDYVSHPHEISPSTAIIRNKQLEIRLWELGCLFAFATRLNEGFSDSEIDEDFHIFPLAVKGDKASKIAALNMFKDRLEMSPGSVTWSGHSFGGATTVQFVKSCWYSPLLNGSEDLKEPLYTPSEALLRHFHPSGTIGRDSKAPATVLLDTWCLPLLGERTRALWRKPLPGPTLGILSWQFYKWKENLRGFRHVMSRKGGIFESPWFTDAKDDQTPVLMIPDGSEEADRYEEVTQRKKLQRSSSLDVTPQLPTGFRQGDEQKLQDEQAVEEEEEEDVNTLSLKRTASRVSQRSVPGQPDRKLYYAAGSAHMSQSDFGILFPRSAKYFTKVDDSEGVLDLNVRAVVEFMREQGMTVADFKEGNKRDAEIFGEEALKGWELASLELGDEGKGKKGDEEFVKSDAVKTKL
ncbi:hypothetical protein H072_4408 [Dactylellina haptotyla CBS 200.50]|uniref:1-alkyl-2-acetylglycerophosphocholine esterase n=1 Tax=Dactylellina haptotyla (strain CBS 200.50) TaxID=1284197 RepID=S8BQE8_DACHA|nr:hypothetical protein H072_4408 [Dactylellina haptotyla CBS 200.50]